MSVKAKRNKLKQTESWLFVLLTGIKQIRGEKDFLISMDDGKPCRLQAGLEEPTHFVFLSQILGGIISTADNGMMVIRQVNKSTDDRLYGVFFHHHHWHVMETYDLDDFKNTYEDTTNMMSARFPADPDNYDLKYTCNYVKKI